MDKPVSEPDGNERTRKSESLGWMAQSGVMPKKQRTIEGVTASSMVELQAQLYRTQEQARLKNEGVDTKDESIRKKSGFKVNSLLSKKNAGVDERNSRDVDALKKTTTTMDCYKALEAKAELYAKIARGEAPDDEEVYNVDFVRKGYLEEEPGPSAAWDDVPEEREPFNAHGTGGMMSADMQMERDREAWEAEARRNAQEESEREERRRIQREVIQELSQDTRNGRERVQKVKTQRETQAERNRERLKAAFLQKQVEKLRAKSASKK